MGVGLLFILAAGLFFFSQKVPDGITTEPSEKANKALITLTVMTVLLAIMFVPVFSSYKSAEAAEILTLGNEIVELNAANSETINLDLILSKETKLAQISKGLENYRMSWLIEL